MHIKIRADENDADFVEKTTQITEEELELIRPLVKAIKEFKPYEEEIPEDPLYPDKKLYKRKHYHNFPTGDMIRDDMGEKSPYQLYVETGLCSEDAMEFFYELLPGSEYGIHTIYDIEVFQITPVETLMKGRM